MSKNASNLNKNSSESPVDPLARLDPGEGNTISSPKECIAVEKDGKGGKTPRITASKPWCFTWNNYPEDWMDLLAPSFEGAEWIGVPEVGESGTPHIQGYVEFPIKVRPIGYKGAPKQISWRKARGSRQQNVTYCTKDGGAGKQGTIKVPRQLKLIEPTYDWEQKILKIISEEPDDRIVHWYWSESGKTGKTSFAKYLTVKHDAIAVSGKGADVRNAVCTYLKEKGHTPELVIFPIPRSYKMEYMNYEALENIKDMYFYSGKYEGGMVCGPCPHLFIFANNEPDYNKISTDRWNVVKID